MTNEELRAKIYQWLNDYYGINVLNPENEKKRKVLRKIVSEFNPKPIFIPQPKKYNPIRVRDTYVSGEVSGWKPYTP